MSAAMKSVVRPIRDFKRGLDVLPKSINNLEQDLEDLKRQKKDTFSVSEIRRLNAEIERTERKINDLEGTTGRVGGIGSKIKSSLGGVGAAIAGAFAVSEIVNFGREVTGVLAKFEKSEAVLTNLFGDSSVAKKVLKDITDFAAKTPFQVDELTESYVKLANQGFAPNMTQMMQLSDLASSTGKDFDQLSEAILDAQTGEFERLKEFGIRAEKSGNKVGFTFKGIKTEVDFAAGSIQDYLLGLGNLNGVQGASASIMETTGGKISNLTDKLTSLKLQIGQELKPVISGILEVTSGWVDKLGDAVKWVSENQEAVVGWAKAIGKVTVALLASFTAARTIMGIVTIINSIKKAYMAYTLAVKSGTVAQALLNVVMAANPVGLLTAGIMAAIGVIYLMVENWDYLKGYLISFGEYFLKFSPFGWLLQITDYFFPAVKEGLMSMLDWIIDKFGMLADWIGGLFNFTDVPVSFDVEEPESEDFYAGLGGTTTTETAPTGGTGKTKTKGLSLGLSDVKGGGGNVKHITININKLVEQFMVQTSTIGMSKAQVKDEMAKVLLSVVNDVNYQ